MDGWMEMKTNGPFSRETVLVPIDTAPTAASGSGGGSTDEPVPSDCAAGWAPLNLRLNPGSGPIGRRKDLQPAAGCGLTRAVIRRAVTARTAVRPRRLIKRDGDTLKAVACLAGLAPGI